ncbi:MAG: hypothetical protein R3320_13365 [Nitriliruptorales bacterium]|nr:hypothetical protein [Nitriliruptorales bacterium]
MTLRRSIALVVCLLSVAGFVLQVTLESLASDPAPLSWGFAAVFLSFALTGGIVAYHRPDNLTGWFLLAIGATESVDGSGLDLYVSSMSAGWQAWATVALACGVALNAVGPGLNTLMLLVFPTGRLLAGKRWRIAAAATVVWMVAVFASTLATGLRATPGSVVPELGLFRAAPLLLIVGVVAVVARFRRSSSEVRQQVKWVGFSATLLVVGLGLLVMSEVTGVDGTAASVTVFLVFLLALLSMPLAVGIAILRHRLFDIDRLISRTVGYAALTAVLGAGYLLIVLGLSAAMRAIGGSSDLAVAVSTLAIAAVFQPVRHRVQHLVDRRFNRSRYDAARTAEAFGATLRDEVQLWNLAHDLRQVVGATMAPVHATVWLAHRSRR